MVYRELFFGIAAGFVAVPEPKITDCLRGALQLDKIACVRCFSVDAVAKCGYDVGFNVVFGVDFIELIFIAGLFGETVSVY